MRMAIKPATRTMALPGLALRRGAFAGGSLVAFLALVHTTTDAFSSMFTALLPTVQARFGLTATTLALLVGVFSLISAFGQPLLGTLADRLGMRLIGALSIALSTLLVSLVSIVPAVELLPILLLIGSIGSAAFHPAGMSMARTAGGVRKHLAVSVFGAGGTLGVAIGPVIILFVVSTFGLGATPWVLALGAALGGVAYRVLPARVAEPRAERHRTFDRRLLIGPVGLLTLAEVFASLAPLTFMSAVPLWLVNAHGVRRDASLIGWTLAAFSLSAALGGIAAGLLSARVSPRLLAPGTLLLALFPLLALLSLTPGTPPFFAAVTLAGALMQVSLPILVVSAQDFAPRAVAAASGMLMGVATGIAGVLYIGIGRLQDLVGLAPAMCLGFLAVIPAALVTFVALTKYRVSADAVVPVVVAGSRCSCAGCACTILAGGDARGQVTRDGGVRGKDADAACWCAGDQDARRSDGSGDGPALQPPPHTRSDAHALVHLRHRGAGLTVQTSPHESGAPDPFDEPIVRQHSIGKRRTAGHLSACNEDEPRHAVEKQGMCNG